MGIQVSSAPQRYGEALVRSGIVGKIREVHTFSNKSWGDDKPLPPGTIRVPRPSMGELDWRVGAAPVQGGCIIRESGDDGSGSVPGTLGDWVVHL